MKLRDWILNFALRMDYGQGGKGRLDTLATGSVVQGSLRGRPLSVPIHCALKKYGTVV